LGEAKKTGIRHFLNEFKKIAVSGRGLDIVPRRENLDALSDLGLTKKNLKKKSWLCLFRIIAKDLNLTETGLERYGYLANT
jgi:hypothetical protein